MEENEKNNNSEQKIIDSDQFIICPKCKAVNKNERYCHNCNADLLESENDEEEQIEENIDFSDSSNKTVNKFKLIALLTKIEGSIISVVIGIILIASVSFWIGLIVGLIIAVVSWLFAFVFEGITEALKILYNISDKN